MPAHPVNQCDPTNDEFEISTNSHNLDRIEFIFTFPATAFDLFMENVQFLRMNDEDCYMSFYTY